MKGENVQQRCKALAIRIIKMTGQLSKEYPAQVLTNQIVRSSTSAGANYRAACRAKSRKDFINKLKIAEEELDETMYWLEIIGEAEFFPQERLKLLIEESNELISIIVKSLMTARKNDKLSGITPK